MKNLSIGLKISIVILIMLFFFCRTNFAGAASIVSTDKDVYNYGETIKVNFSNSPGSERDWICIVPAGAPDTEGGEYKYLPRGAFQGTLTFHPTAPGKYEVRAYYNYDRNGYVVSGRSAFSVKGGADYEKAMTLQMERLERKVDTGNPLEANLAQDKGFVYIFREPEADTAMQRFVADTSIVNAQIKADRMPLAVMLNASYYIYEAPAGDVILLQAH